MRELVAEVETALGVDVRESRPLGVGFGLSGLRARLADGREVAVKAASHGAASHGAAGDGAAGDSGESYLALEGRMLRALAEHSELPVPAVLHADARLLVMSWIENDGGSIGASAQRHAAELLAALHGKVFPQFGWGEDTLIGPFAQPNPQEQRWIPFFRDHRLMFMARAALEEGCLPTDLFGRIERLAGRLDDFLTEPDHPALVHGDLWTGNVLVKDGQIAGFIDPAIYVAHPEIELAFTTMFGTFDRAFFEAYEAFSPLEPGFHETRRALYNLYPTLVHVRLFGAGYLAPIADTLSRFGP